MEETSKQEPKRLIWPGGPGWPDARAWGGVAIVGLTWKILTMIEANPALLANASFMQLAGGVVGAGGLGLFLAFHFASSAGTAKANQRADAAERRAEKQENRP